MTGPEHDAEADAVTEEPTTVVPRDQVAGATPLRNPRDEQQLYPASQDYSAGREPSAGRDDAAGTDDAAGHNDAVGRNYGGEQSQGADQGYRADQNYGDDRGYRADQSRGADQNYAAADDSADGSAASPADDAQAHGYPVTRDPEIAEMAAASEQADTTQQLNTSRPGQDATRAYRVPQDPPTQQAEAAGPAGYRAPQAYSAAPHPDLSRQPQAAPAPGYQSGQEFDNAPGGPGGQGAPGGQDGPAGEQTYGSASTGFFAPQAVAADRVELAPAKTRIGQNLLGALLGLIFVAGAAALYALTFKNLDQIDTPNTGHKLALIGIALVIAVPALLSGWAPAAGWLPGIILVLGVGVAMFSNSLAHQYAEWSNSLFGTTAAAQLLLQWGMVAGFALLLAGIGAQLARRSAEHSVIDRIVNRSS